MRPRHKAAENAEMDGKLYWLAADASMRPRHKAAENQAEDVAVCFSDVGGFNEAAA